MITVQVYDEEPQIIPAIRIGQLAVHNAVNSKAVEPHFMITHVASGLSITPFLMRLYVEPISMEAAFALAERCAEIDFDAFWEKNKGKEVKPPKEYQALAKQWDKEFDLGIWS